MTSNAKRKYDEFKDVKEETQSSFLYDPASPLYSFGFVDQLVQQYCPRVDEEKPLKKMELECCPRAYEDDFLREPVGNEHFCANDKECEGMKINCPEPFILREFMLPSQSAEADVKSSNDDFV